AEIGIGNRRALLPDTLVVEHGHEHEQRQEHARQDKRALDPGVALRFLVVVHFHSLSRFKIGRRAGNTMVSATFAAARAAPSTPLRPSPCNRPVRPSYPPKVEQALDRATGRAVFQPRGSPPRSS